MPMGLKQVFVFLEYVFYHALHKAGKGAGFLYALVDFFQERLGLNFFGLVGALLALVLFAWMAGFL
jgi:hypothetical protein